MRRSDTLDYLRAGEKPITPFALFQREGSLHMGRKKGRKEERVMQEQKKEDRRKKLSCRCNPREKRAKGYGIRGKEGEIDPCIKSLV